MKPPTRKSQTEALREQIAETRKRIDETLAALSQRATPQHLADEALGLFRTQKGAAKLGEWKETAATFAQSTAKNVAESVKANPWPALLIGAGAAWWAISAARSDRASDAEESVSYSPDEYEEESRIEPDITGAGRLATDAPPPDGGISPPSSVAEEAREKLRRTMQSARRAYSRSREAVVDTARGHPLEIGLGVLAVGVAVGLLLPTPKKANQLVGARADRLRERAREAGRDLIRRGKSVANAASQAARSEAEAQGLLKKKSQVPTLENIPSQGAANVGAGASLPPQGGDSPLPPAEEV